MPGFQLKISPPLPFLPKCAGKNPVGWPFGLTLTLETTADSLNLKPEAMIRAIFEQIKAIILKLLARKRKEDKG